MIVQHYFYAKRTICHTLDAIVVEKKINYYYLNIIIIIILAPDLVTTAAWIRSSELG